MRIEERGEQPYRGTSRVGPDATVNIGEMLPPVYEWLEIRGVEPAGTPFFRYHAGQEDIEVEAAVPVPRGSAIPASDEDVTAGMLPAGRYVVTEIRGDAEEPRRSIADLIAWAGKQNLTLDDEGNTWTSRILEDRTELAIRVTD